MLDAPTKAGHIISQGISLISFLLAQDLHALQEHIISSFAACCRFHVISYDIRMTVVAVMMTCSYMTVAYGQHVSWQLLGVAFAAFQGGLGEASTLALCSLYDSRRALTLWSSGTGFAGSQT